MWMSRLGFLQLLCAFKQLKFSSFYLSLSASITFLWFSKAHAVVLRLAAIVWRCIHSHVHSHWNLHILAFIGETISVRTNKYWMSRLGFSNEPFRVFATVVFLQTTQVFFLLPFSICIYSFSSFYRSLSTSITSLSFTFLYLHLFYGFFLVASIISLPFTFLYLHLFYGFFLAASITYLPSTFLYLHLFYDFFLAASITSLPSTFLYMYLFYCFFLTVRASE